MFQARNWNSGRRNRKSSTFIKGLNHHPIRAESSVRILFQLLSSLGEIQSIKKYWKKISNVASQNSLCSTSVKVSRKILKFAKRRGRSSSVLTFVVNRPISGDYEVPVKPGAKT